MLSRRGDNWDWRRGGRFARGTVFLCVLVVVVLAGCARPDIAPVWLPWPATATPTPRPEPLSLLAPAVNEDANAVIADAVSAFEAAVPGRRVAGMLVYDYPEVLAARLADEEIPDVFVAWSHQLGDLIADGSIRPIPSTQSDGAILPSSLDATVQVSGTTYCLPRDVAPLALYYNPAAFDRVEASYPAADWGWQTLRSAAEATTDRDFGYYGLALELDISRLYPFLAQSAADDNLWSGPDAASAVDFFMELFDDGVAVEPLAANSSWAGEAFGRGRIAMTIEGPWLVGYLESDFPDLDFAVVELPAGPVRRATVAFVSCWVTGNQGADPEGSAILAAELGAPGRSVAWAAAAGTLPPSIEQATALVGMHRKYRPFVSELSYALPWMGRAGFTAEIEAANSAMRLWLNDEATTPDLLARIAAVGERAAP